MTEHGMNLQKLREKARWVRAETLRIHAISPETRIASSLSPVEIFVALYYGGILRFRAAEPRWPGRDRFIISKGHGSVSLYPILADLGYFSASELARVGREGSFLGGIPDPVIPGYESVNGSLGHGLGVGCGMALSLRRARSDREVFVLLGDGEMNEGSIWEAVMFAGHHRLDNLIAIVDNNKICMLDYCSKVLDLEPLDRKFTAFGWRTRRVDGHDISAVLTGLAGLREERGQGPGVLIADTVKGKGVPALETDPLCHVRNIPADRIEAAIQELPW